MAFLKNAYSQKWPVQLCSYGGHWARFSLCLFFFSFLAMLVYSFALAREPVVSSECELKTAFIYQFTKYISWPDKKKNKKELVIGVAAEDEMLDAISRLEGRTSQGMTIVVLPVDDLSDLEKIDLLYLGKGWTADEDIIDKAIKYHVLTISDEDNAVQKGVIIGLYMADSRLRFDINLKVANKSNLRLSSRLLRLAGSLVQ